MHPSQSPGRIPAYAGTTLLRETDPISQPPSSRDVNHTPHRHPGEGRDPSKPETWTDARLRGHDVAERDGPNFTATVIPRRQSHPHRHPGEQCAGGRLAERVSPAPTKNSRDLGKVQGIRVRADRPRTSRIHPCVGACLDADLCRHDGSSNHLDYSGAASRRLTAARPRSANRQLRGAELQPRGPLTAQPSNPW